MKRALLQEDQQHQVDETNNGLKLYSVCRKFFPFLSKSQLREALKHGAIKLNDRVMEITDDTKRVNSGDIIHLSAEKQNNAANKRLLQGHGSNVPIHYCSDHFSIVEKEAGVGCHSNSDFYLRLKYLLWDGEMINREKQMVLKGEKVGGYGGLQLLYNPGKSASGLLVIVRNCASMMYVRSLLETKKMKIVCSCIVCGKLGEEGSEIVMNDDGDDKRGDSSSCTPSEGNNEGCGMHSKKHENRDENRSLGVDLHVKIVKVCKSRSAGYLSHLQITPVFTALPPHDEYGNCSTEEIERMFTTPSCKRDYDHILFPSRVIKGIRYYFLRRNNPIVGENDIVKKTKGVFISITRVCFTNANGQGDDVDIAVNDPVKFATLLNTEEQLWKTWDEKNRNILNENHYNGVDSQEAFDLLSQGYPVQYITGKAQFHGYEFIVDKTVMIPRKSSEVLVTAAVDFVLELVNTRRHGESYIFTLLDLGTGSGSLLLSSMLELKKAGIRVKGIGVDISPEALNVARLNARAHSIEDDEITFEIGNFETIDRTLFSSSAEESLTTSIDVILCNPPYSSIGEVHRLSMPVVEHEPQVALYCSDGQSTGNYHILSKLLLRVVEEGTRITLCKRYSISNENRCIFEIGHGQADEVKRIFLKKKVEEEEGRFRLVSSLRDHNDILRCLVYSLDTASKKGST